jgi:hypothetical protein
MAYRAQLPRALPPDSESSRPGDLKVLDDGDAETGDEQFIHPIVERTHTALPSTGGALRSQIGNYAIDPNSAGWLHVRCTPNSVD